MHVVHVLSMDPYLQPPLHQLALTRSLMSALARADYEVDFITFFTRLTGTKMGAKFDDEAYLVPIKIDIPRL